jgi:transposase
VLNLPPTVRIYLCSVPTDMRRSFDSLAAQAHDVLHQDPLSGHLFVFRNRPGDRMKILFWDRTGYWILYKRLEEGVFHFPENAGDHAEIAATDLLLILEGLDLAGATQRRRYSRRGIPVLEK